jgi:hypothetical protein
MRFNSSISVFLLSSVCTKPIYFYLSYFMLASMQLAREMLKSSAYIEGEKAKKRVWGEYHAKSIRNIFILARITKAAGSARLGSAHDN